MLSGIDEEFERFPSIMQLKNRAVTMGFGKTKEIAPAGSGCSMCNDNGYMMAEVNGFNGVLGCYNCRRGRYYINRELGKFPSVKEFPKAKITKLPQPHSERVWISKQAPGTPASVEAIFEMIEGGDTERKAFALGLKYCGLNEEKIWKCYESWKIGEVHPMIKNIKDSDVVKKSGVQV